MFYAIKVPSSFGDSWVNAPGGRYSSINKTPTLFADKKSAQAVIREYKAISRNCNKQPSPMKIVQLGEI